MSSVVVGGTIIGEGRPKICLPIVAKDRDGILSEATHIRKSRLCDICEWRIDFFDSLLDENGKLDEEAVLTTVRELHNTLGSVPLLVTFRSKNEGGNMQINSVLYENLLLMLCQSGYADMIDLELFTGEGLFGRMVKSIHSYGVKVIASSHDFEKTPEAVELKKRLKDMADAGADICKLAVMPQTMDDVHSLLEVTYTSSRELTKPVVTMAMGGLGSISRLTGEFFGSAMTFGTLGKSSAPGQIDAFKLSTVLGIIHENMNGIQDKRAQQEKADELS